MWQNIWSRVKSPVVIAQIITIIMGAVVLLAPEIAPTVKIIAGAIIAILNIFAGLNNPTDKENF